MLHGQHKARAAPARGGVPHRVRRAVHDARQQARHDRHAARAAERLTRQDYSTGEFMVYVLGFVMFKRESKISIQCFVQDRQAA